MITGDVIDKRVVEMEFDNESFEKNVKTSINTLERLKSALSFEGSAEALNKTLKSVNTTVLSAAVDTVSNKFTVLEVVAITSIANITNKLIELGTQITKSLSVDQVMGGWASFEAESKSVGTLVTALTPKFKTMSNTMAEAQKQAQQTVETQLGELAWFSDQTSYSYDHMLDTIAKFSGAGVELDDAVAAVEGIALWAAEAGQGTDRATQAMYQLAQAMSKGSVKYQDWMSIEGYSMATPEFKKKVLDAAKALGVLQEAIDGTISYEGTVIAKWSEELNDYDLSGFTTSLSKGWFSKEVLTKVLNDYASSVDKLREITGDDGTVSEGLVELNKYLDENTENLSEAEIELLKFSAKNLEAATECRTFTDALNAAKDAVKTTYKDIFKSIFGDYLQAKELWTNMYNDYIYPMFVESNVNRKSIFMLWSKEGRDDIVGTNGVLINLLKTFTEIKKAFSSAFSSVTGFGKSIEEDAAKIKSFTGWLQKITSAMVPSERTLESITGILRGLFSVLKLGWKIASGFWIGIKPLVSLFFDGADGLAGGIAKVSNKFADWVDNLTIFEKVGRTVAVVTQGIADIFRSVFAAFTGNSTFASVIKAVSEAFQNGVDSISKSLAAFRNMNTKPMGDFADDCEKKLGPLEKLFAGIVSLFEGVWSILKSIVPVIGSLLSFIGDALKSLGEKISAIFSGKDSAFNINSLLGATAWTSLAAYASYMLAQFVSWSQAFKNVVLGFADVLDSKAIMQYAEALRTFAIAILIIVGAMVLLAGMDADKIATSLTVITAIITGLLTAMKYMGRMMQSSITDIDNAKSFFGNLFNLGNTFLKANAMKAAATALISLAIAIGVMALSVKVLSTIEPDRLIFALAGVTALLVEMIFAMKVLNAMKSKLLYGSTAMLALATSVSILATSLMILSAFKISTLMTRVGVIAALMSLVVVISKTISGKDAVALAAFSAAMLELMTALTIFAIAAGIMSKVKPGVAWNMVGIISSLVLIMSLIMKATSIFDTVKIIAFGAGMVLLGIAMAEMAASIKILGEMDASSVKQGRKAVTDFIAIIALALKLVGFLTVTKLMPFAKGLSMLGVAMLEMTAVIKILGEMDSKALTKGMGALLGTLAILSILSKGIGIFSAASLFVMSAAILALSIAMTTLAGAFAAMAALKWKSLIGLGILAGVIAALVVSASLLKPFTLEIVAISVSLLMVASACFILVSALSLLAATGEIAGIVLISMVGTLIDGFIGLAPKIAEGIAKLIESLSLGLAASLQSVMILVYGVIDSIIQLLRDRGAEIIEIVVELITVLLENLAANGDRIATSLIEILKSVFKVLVSNTKEFTMLLVDFLIATIDGLIEKLPDLLDALGRLIIALVDGVILKIVEIKYKLDTALFDLIVGLIDGLGQAIEDNVTKIVDAVKRFGEHIINAFKKVFGIHSPSTVMEKIGKFLVDGLYNGIKNIGTVIRDYIRSAFTNVKEWFTNVFNSFKEVGKNIIVGIKEGITNNLQTALDAVKTGATKIADKFKSILGIHSPSRVFAGFGKNIDEGLAIGIDGNSDIVDNSVTDLTDTAVSGMQTALTKVAELVENGMDDQLTIRPVLDLTDIQNGTNEIYSMMSDVDGYAVSGSASLARRTSDDISRVSQSRSGIISSNVNNNSQAEPTNTITNTFNITGSNAKDIADQVAQRIQQQIDRRKSKWAL